MKRSQHMILRLVLVLIPVLLAVAQARSQADTVCVGGTSVWAVENIPGDTYTWELYNDVTGINFATDPGNCPSTEAYFVGGVDTGDSVNVMCLEPGTYFVKVKAVNSCTDNLKVGMIVVEECYSYATFQQPQDFCQGDSVTLIVDITGAPGPWDITYTDGTTTWTETGITSSPHEIHPDPNPTTPGTYTYWITSVSNPYMTNDTPSAPVTFMIKPKPNTSPIYRY